MSWIIHFAAIAFLFWKGDSIGAAGYIAFFIITAGFILSIQLSLPRKYIPTILIDVLCLIVDYGIAIVLMWGADSLSGLLRSLGRSLENKAAIDRDGTRALDTDSTVSEIYDSSDAIGSSVNTFGISSDDYTLIVGVSCIVLSALVQILKNRFINKNRA